MFVCGSVSAQQIQPTKPYRTNSQNMVTDSAWSGRQILIPAFVSPSLGAWADRPGQSFGLRTSNNRLSVRGVSSWLEFPSYTEVQSMVSASGGVNSVFGRSGVVIAQTSDYSAFYPGLSGSYSNPSWITSLAWNKISGPPTTLSGYGITDAYPLSGNPSGFLTSFTESDPTVPSYAKSLTAFSVIKPSTDALYAPISGSVSYIQNQVALAQTGGFNLSGNGTLNGQLLLFNSSVSFIPFQSGAGTGSYAWQISNSGSPVSRQILRSYSGGVENIRFDPSSTSFFLNNVGIGGTTASVKLDVTGGARVSVAPTQPTDVVRKQELDLKDNLPIINTSITTTQTSSSLNTAYPTAVVGQQVTAPNVGTGMKYEKINTTGGGTWIAWAATTI